jgi:retron-type reverse transcriptase
LETLSLLRPKGGRFLRKMKTYKNLYPQIITFENLRLAFKKAARGKRSRPDVAHFEYYLEPNLVRLQAELASETYRPGVYDNFHIFDPKPRLISAAPFSDRVVHHALCRVIEPLFERRFIYDSYACRVGKGTHAALDRCTEFARRYPYALKCDIEHFFPSMDLTLLQGQLARLIACPPTLRLCQLILDGGAGIHRQEHLPSFFPGDDLWAALRPVGLPIGNLTSQFWANVYLDPLDQYIKRELKCKAYIRYVDDLLLFADNKRQLHAWRGKVIDFLAGWRLRLHENQAAVSPVSAGIPFLGWRIFPDHRRLRRRNGVTFQRRFARLRRELAAGVITFDQVQASVQSWVAHAMHGDTWGLRRAILCAEPL